MTQTLYLDFSCFSQRDAYYLFYKNYPLLIQMKDISLTLLTPLKVTSLTYLQVHEQGGPGKDEISPAETSD